MRWVRLDSTDDVKVGDKVRMMHSPICDDLNGIEGEVVEIKANGGVCMQPSLKGIQRCRRLCYSTPLHFPVNRYDRWEDGET